MEFPRKCCYRWVRLDPIFTIEYVCFNSESRKCAHNGNIKWTILEFPPQRSHHDKWDNGKLDIPQLFTNFLLGMLRCYIGQLVKTNPYLRNVFLLQNTKVRKYSYPNSPPERGKQRFIPKKYYVVLSAQVSYFSEKISWIKSLSDLALISNRV